MEIDETCCLRCEKDPTPIFFSLTFKVGKIMTIRTTNVLTFKAPPKIPKELRDSWSSAFSGGTQTQSLSSAEGYALISVCENDIKLTFPTSGDAWPSDKVGVFCQFTMHIYKGNCPRAAFVSFRIDGELISFPEQLAREDTFGFDRLVISELDFDTHTGEVSFHPNSLITFQGGNAPFKEYALKLSKEAL